MFRKDVLYGCSYPYHSAALTYLEVNGTDEEKKKGVYFIFLGGSPGGKEVQGFLSIPTCDFWLLSSSMLGSLVCTQCKLEVCRKNPLRQERRKKGS